MNHATRLLSVLPLLVATTQAAVVFQQDFSSSSNINDYVGNGANQFTSLSNAASSSFSIDSGRLLINRDASAGSDYASLRIAREGSAANFNAAITTGFKLTADFSVFSQQGDTGAIFVTTAGFLQFGNQQGGTARFDTSAASATNFYLAAQGGSGAGNTWSTGSATVTWVVNNTGSDYTYTAPDASSRTLGTGLYDLWIGSNSSGSRLGVVYTVNASGFNSIDFGIPGWSGGDAVIALDNLVVSDFTAVPEPSAFAALLGAGVFGSALVRRRRRVAS